MLSKFSVKKPYTVIVGVILVIVLGVISFANMTTDLLPNMDLPYVAVYTTYIGATPEQVESDITRPIGGLVRHAAEHRQHKFHIVGESLPRRHGV